MGIFLLYLTEEVFNLHLSLYVSHYMVLQSLKEDDHLVWDKDDNNAMDFVASCANIRAHIFSIPQKTRFDIKCKYDVPQVVVNVGNGGHVGAILK
jgi:hypothetical protein